MVAYCPSNAGGIGGRCRSTTEEDIGDNYDITQNYYAGGTNVLATNLHTNHNNHHHFQRNTTKTRHQRRLHYHPYLHQPRVGPFVHGSPFDEDKALRSFRDQSRQYDRGPTSRLANDQPCPELRQATRVATLPTPTNRFATTSQVPPRAQGKHGHGSAPRASRYASASRTAIMSFDRGARSFIARNRPTNETLIEMTTRKSRRAKRKIKDTSLKATALQLAQAQSTALQQVETTRTSLQATSKYGHSPRLKPAHTVRIAMENFNSLCVTSGNAKITALNNICREYNVDILCGCETQVDWRQVPQSRRFPNLFGVGTETRSVVAHNINERMRPNQFGGCAMMAFNTISSDVIDTGVDITGLGRWCWFLLGSGRKRTRIVMAYQPSNSGRSAGTTVKDQQARYFQALGDARSPRTIFFEQLVSQLAIWKMSDNDIVLLGDFNEHVYNGRLATRITAADLNFRELCHDHTGLHLPPTFRTGSIPIDGIFATPGIECVNVTLLPHLGGVGDHRCFIIDLSSESVLGTDFPNIVRVASRKLHCTTKRMIRLYNAELTAKCEEHNMFGRMDELFRLTDYLETDDFGLIMNALDTEFMQLMLHSENEVNKFMMGHIEWSPTIGIWLSRRWLLKRVQQWMQGIGTPDPRNMFRECYRMNIPDPRKVSYETICAHIVFTNAEISRLAKDAPALRREHLLGLIENAEEKSDTARVQAILEILRREAQKKKWRKINYSTRPPRGAAPTCIQVETPSGTTTYRTEDEIFEHSSHHLSLRFRHAYSAPVYGSTLIQEVGPLGDTDRTQEILEGTFTYPHDTDLWTTKFFEEAQHTYALLGSEGIDTAISVSDFQGFWQCANENKSSSFSGGHYGHYKAASFDKHLSAFHAAKLTACARKGVVLSRWTVGLTVLLEKTPGNNKIHKMRGIVLVEADYNYYMKEILARRMLRSAQERNQIPVECFAKKGSNCINAVMTKIMFCDESRTHHHPTCIGGNDFADCYDRMAHPPASIALQSFGLPRPAIRVLLIAMQTMRFFLRTGFGESTKSYGGSVDNPTLSLGQGNAAAGPTFLAISSLIVNAYLRQGHGARTTTSITNRLVILAAVLYVDDTDSIHMAPKVTDSPTELIQHAQKSTDAWGGLSIATGAAMKPEKCYAYFMTYTVRGGHHILESIDDLPTPSAQIPQGDDESLPSHLSVPLPDGTRAPIPTLPPTTASLMLGVWFGPASRGTKHMNEMCKKGYSWADRLSSRPLSHSDAWTSFNLQLYPGMSWGIATVVLSPQEIYLATKPVYFKCLPLLGVQRHIELPWRMLPECYQGIGLPNFSLISLSTKLQLIQGIWGFQDAASKSLRMGYESFLMDVGLYGNVFGYKYNHLSALATDHTWFKNIWELLQEFKVDASFGASAQLQPVRKGDRSLMSEFSKFYSGRDLQNLNVFRQFKKVIHVSCIVLCDGHTVNKECLTLIEGRSDHHKFPLQRPSLAAQRLWAAAIRRISSDYLVFPETLGQYVRAPHKNHRWTTNREGTVAHSETNLDGTLRYIVYSLGPERETRSGRRMRRVPNLAASPLTYYASVVEVDDDTVILHSWVQEYQAPTATPRDFWQSIHNDGNQSLWRTLKCDGNGDWIGQGLLSGTLLVAHDGSYIKEVAADVCSAAVMIYCTRTRQTCTCTIVEQSLSAGSYRGEVLGAILAQLILRAASTELIGPFPVLCEDCDNNGVVLHGNSVSRPLPASQAQADVLRVMKKLISKQLFTTKFAYVRSHTDKLKPLGECTQTELMNIIVDDLAQNSLRHACSTEEYFDGIYPNEDCIISMQGVKITGPIRDALEQHWGKTEAKRFFDFKNIVESCNFDLIWWEGVGKAMASYPKMFRVFVTKQVSGWCGSNSKQSLWDTTISTMCPNCGIAKETSKHLTRCTHVGRVRLFRSSVADVITCLEVGNVDVDLITMIEDYLLLQGSDTMVNQAPIGSQFLDYAKIHDDLGWDSFLEGRIPVALLDAVRHSLPSRRSLTKWGVSLIKALLGITHRQWLFRNADVHHRFEGLTMHDHNLLSLRIRELLTTPPDNLLPTHRYLLQQDFAQLGEADTIQRQIWVANMNSALGAASHFHSGHLTPGSLHKFFQTRRRATLPPRSPPHAQHSQRQHQHRSRRPCQQTLPASFWTARQHYTPHENPPDFHSTDLTGAHYRLHWRRK